jgi:hypothetical protein
MNWMLVIIVLGTQPVKTDLVFDTLQKCSIAGDLMRSEQGVQFYNWQSATRTVNPDWGFWRRWSEESSMRRRLGMENETTCIPHSLR